MAIEAEKLLAVFEARFSSLEKAVDRAVAKSQKGFGDIEKAGTQAEKALGQIGTKGVPGIDKATQAIKGARIETGQLAAQFNDIATQLAGGQSPFLIALQQGSQITQALGDRGAKASVLALGGAFTSLLNPVNLATLAFIGLGGTAVQYVVDLLSDIPDADEAIKKHAALIKEIADAYDVAVGGANNYAKSLPTLAAEGRQNLATMKALGRTATKKFFDKFGEGFVGRRQGFTLSSDTAAFKEPFDELLRGIRSGSADFDKFQRQIEAIGNTDPKLQEKADTILTSAQAMVDAMTRVKEASDAIEFAKGEIGEMAEAFAKLDQQIDAVNYDPVRKELEGLREEAHNGKIGVADINLALTKLAEANPRFTGALNALRELYDRAVETRDVVAGINQVIPEPSLTPLYSYGGKFTDSEGGQIMTDPSIEQNKELAAALRDAIPSINAFVENVVRAESGGRADAKNPNSSATGAGQFIASTWLDLFRRYYPDEAAHMGRDAILALRKDADKSRALIFAYAKENAQVLQRAGVHVDEASLQLAHFLGAGDAAKVLGAAPGTPLAGLISQASINANPTILGGGRTVDDAIAYGQRRASAPVGGYSSSRQAKKTPAEIFEGDQAQVQARIDLMNAEYEAQSRLNPLIKDYGFEVEKAKIEQQLLNDAKRAGVTVTPELAASIDTLATNYAKASAASVQLRENQQNLAQSAQEFNALGRDVLGGFISDLRSGKSAAEALQNALGKIADRLLDMALNSIFPTSGGGGLGGILAMIFGGGKASGGPVSRGKAYVVGEKGPELFAPGRSGTILPNDMLTSPPAPIDLRQAKRAREVIDIRLQDDSGRMASIADQRIETHSGSIINVSVAQSGRQGHRAFPGRADYNAKRGV